MAGEFHICEDVVIICHDGAVFRGFIMDFTEDYVVLGPHAHAFPLEDIVDMERP